MSITRSCAGKCLPTRPADIYTLRSPIDLWSATDFMLLFFRQATTAVDTWISVHRSIAATVVVGWADQSVKSRCVSLCIYVWDWFCSWRITSIAVRVSLQELMSGYKACLTPCFYLRFFHVSSDPPESWRSANWMWSRSGHIYSWTKHNLRLSFSFLYVTCSWKNVFVMGIDVELCDP
jgi:hypothetical protein